jgi:hypothetical protein
MNVFVLDDDPVLAAQMQCDKHVVKMALESAQLLCSMYPPDYPGLPVKVTHYNHPSAVWARACPQNYLWLLKHARALFKEYTYRYGRVHVLDSVPSWTEDNSVAAHVGTPRLPRSHVFVGPTGYEGNDGVVAAYRRYYMMEKRRFATYTRRSPPDWFKQALADPPTVPIKASRRTPLLLGIPSTIKHTHVFLSLYDAHIPGMPAFGSKPLKIWYDGTTDSPHYELAPHSMRVLKKLREYA